MEWTWYISILRQAHVHLSDVEDELVWIYPNVSGRYYAKSGYQALVNDDVDGL
jgi:hypothetical protein